MDLEDAAQALRLDAAYMAFGRSTCTVNRGHNHRCGFGGPHRPCLHEVEHALVLQHQPNRSLPYLR